MFPDTNIKLNELRSRRAFDFSTFRSFHIFTAAASTAATPAAVGCRTKQASGRHGPQPLGLWGAGLVLRNVFQRTTRFYLPIR